MEQLQQLGHHAPLVAAPVSDLQVVAVGENGLIPAGTVLFQPGPGLQQLVVLLLDDGLGPGGGHVRDGPLLIAGAHLLHVGVGDGVGAADVNILSMVGLQSQGGDGLHEGGEILRCPGVQQGLYQHLLPLKIVNGRAVGQHHRGVDGGQVRIWSEGAVGPPGGHREAPALLNPVPDGLYIPGRHPVLKIV